MFQDPQSVSFLSLNFDPEGFSGGDKQQFEYRTKVKGTMRSYLTGPMGSKLSLEEENEAQSRQTQIEKIQEAIICLSAVLNCDIVDFSLHICSIILQYICERRLRSG